MAAVEYWRERNNDEKGTIEPLQLHQIGDKGDGLDGFAKAHFISQDAVQIVVVQRHHPLQALDLD